MINRERFLEDFLILVFTDHKVMIHKSAEMKLQMILAISGS